MPNEITPTAPLKKLITSWAKAKEKENKAKDTRLTIEERIFNALESELPEKGSTRVGDMKITTGTTIKWDQEALKSIKLVWEKTAGPIAFPFEVEYKPDNKTIAYIEDQMPKLYKQLEPAREEKPKKPSFEIN